MRVFISYARERSDLANAVALKLKKAGFGTFLDTEDLPAGASYDDRIRSAVEQCELFLFLVSPESVAPGSYALSELEFAKQRWPHPDERVLPVIAEETPMGTVPPYLRDVTLLAPAGDVAAESVAALVRLRDLRKSRQRRQFTMLGLVVAVIALTTALVWSQFVPEGETYGLLRFQDLRALKAEEGFADEGDIYDVKVRIHNDGETAVVLDDIDAECEHPRLSLTHHPGVYYPETVPIAPGESKAWGFQVRIYDNAKSRFLRDDEVTDPISWRLTWLEQENKRVTEWRPWSTGGRFEPAVAVAIDRRVRYRATHVVAGAREGFFAALTEPPGIVALTDEGEVSGDELGLPAEVSALSRTGGVLLAATSHPAVVHVLDATTLEITKQHPFGPQHVRTKRTLTELSFVPESIAGTESTIWVATKDSETTEPAIYYRKSGDTEWTLPEYVDGFDVRPYQLRLYAFQDRVLGIEATLQPTTIFLFGESEVQEFEGHDHELISTSHDLAVMESGDLRLFSYDNELVQLGVADTGFTRVAGWRTSIQEMHSRDSWQDQLVARAGDQLVAAFSATITEGNKPVRLQLSSFSADGKERELLDADNLIATSLAATERAVLVVTKNANGQRQAFVIAEPYG